MSGLPVKRLNLEKSSITSNRYFHQSKFEYLNINNTQIKDLENISTQELHAENIYIPVMTISRKKMTILNLKRSKISELVFNRSTIIEEFWLNKGNIERLKTRDGFTIEKLYLSEGRQKTKDPVLQKLIESSTEVIYQKD